VTDLQICQRVSKKRDGDQDIESSRERTLRGAVLTLRTPLTTSEASAVEFECERRDADGQWVRDVAEALATALVADFRRAMVESPSGTHHGQTGARSDPMMFNPGSGQEVR
jgi:hypothetical protein